MAGAARWAWREPVPNPQPWFHRAGSEAQAVITACLPGFLRPHCPTPEELSSCQQLKVVSSSHAILTIYRQQWQLLLPWWKTVVLPVTQHFAALLAWMPLRKKQRCSIVMHLC